MEKEAAVASDDDWAEMDQWLSRKLEEPAEQPRNTRQRWETISKGHVHDHFLSQNAKRWEALGASARLSANLEALGFEHPSTAQALCFEPLRNGKDVLLADANGCGKTLAFVAPLVERLWEIEAADGPTPPGQVRAIIIVPTDSLAQQVCELARNVGNRSIRASMATGEHSWHTQRERLAGGLELLVATMGRLAAHISPREMAPSFSLEGVRMLVVDEASSLYQGRVPSWMDKKGGAPPPGQGKGEPMRQELPLAAWKWLLSEAPDTSSVSFITSALPEGVEEQMLEDVGGLTRRVRPGLHRTRAGVELTLVDCTVPARASSSTRAAEAPAADCGRACAAGYAPMRWLRAAQPLGGPMAFHRLPWLFIAFHGLPWLRAAQPLGGPGWPPHGSEPPTSKAPLRHSSA